MKRVAIGMGIAAAAALVFLGGGYAWLALAPRHVPGGQAPLARLDETSLDAFRQTFNDADSGVRVLALLSPT